ncbi:phenylacetate--CoA ligase family protein [Magnetospira thiophila]
MSFLDHLPPGWKVRPEAFIPGVTWLRVPHLGLAPLIHLCEALDRTEWDPTEVLLRRQLVQARAILHVARQQSAHYRHSLAGIDIEATCRSLEAWRRLPLLTRDALQRAGDKIFSDRLPAGHKVGGQVKTSGSTGQPVTVRKTNISDLFFQALSIRHHFWHRRDLTGRVAVIRAKMQRQQHPSWGGGIAQLFRTGPLATLPFIDVAAQLAFLDELQPDFLLTYPSNLRALLDASAARNLTFPKMIEVTTIGETLSADLRDRCQSQWSVKTSDLYSSEEVGNIAFQCPDSGLYHIMAENLIVEVLRDDGTPCQAGETGRIVVTDLHNFATPLIRYDIRDYAEVGGPCSCGRGLPTLSRNMGRSRNMLRTPEGEIRWPLTGFHDFQGIAAVRQYQFIQSELDLIEATLVVTEPLTTAQRDALERVIRDSLHWNHRLNLHEQRDLLPVAANGKFEDFMSRL